MSLQIDLTGLSSSATFNINTFTRSLGSGFVLTSSSASATSNAVGELSFVLSNPYPSPVEITWEIIQTDGVSNDVVESGVQLVDGTGSTDLCCAIVPKHTTGGGSTVTFPVVTTHPPTSVTVDATCLNNALSAILQSFANGVLNCVDGGATQAQVDAYAADIQTQIDAAAATQVAAVNASQVAINESFALLCTQLIAINSQIPGTV
jgi:hypothetical protein